MGMQRPSAPSGNITHIQTNINTPGAATDTPAKLRTDSCCKNLSDERRLWWQRRFAWLWLFGAGVAVIWIWLSLLLCAVWHLQKSASICKDRCIHVHTCVWAVWTASMASSRLSSGLRLTSELGTLVYPRVKKVKIVLHIEMYLFLLTPNVIVCSSDYVGFGERMEISSSRRYSWGNTVVGGCCHGIKQGANIIKDFLEVKVQKKISSTEWCHLSSKWSTGEANAAKRPMLTEEGNTNISLHGMD